MRSSGLQFPSRNIEKGHKHLDVLGGGEYRYLGGDPFDLVNSWLLVGGEISGDPDTTGWGVIQKGANWFNKILNSFRGWNGSAIISLEGNGSTFSGCLVIKTGNQTLSNGVSTIIDFGSEVYDVGGWHDNVTNNSRLTVPANVDRVVLVGHLTWASSSVSERDIFITKNGAGVFIPTPGGSFAATTGSDIIFTVSPVLLDVIEGDFFELTGFQTSGGNLDVTISNFAGSTSFSIRAV